MTTEHNLRRQVSLAQRFVALADTLVDDYDVVEVLDGLMSTCLELLDVDQAGLLLNDAQGNLQRVASSSEEARLLELLQVQTREGPCFEAVQTSQSIIVEDISLSRGSWPTFAARASADGFNSVYAFPMRLRDSTIGGLNLFGLSRAPLDEESRVTAKALADIAAIGILQQRSIHRTSLLAENLQRALNTRIVVEQAKGILSGTGQPADGRDLRPAPLVRPQPQPQAERPGALRGVPATPRGRGARIGSAQLRHRLRGRRKDGQHPVLSLAEPHAIPVTSPAYGPR